MFEKFHYALIEQNNLHRSEKDKEAVIAELLEHKADFLSFLEKEYFKIAIEHFGYKDPPAVPYSYESSKNLPNPPTEEFNTDFSISIFKGKEDIEVLNEFMSNDYTAPDNHSELHYHLSVMWFIYKVSLPATKDINWITLLKLDIATVKLATKLGELQTHLPYIKEKIKHGTSVKRGKGKQKAKTGKKIDSAFEKAQEEFKDGMSRSKKAQLILLELAKTEKPKDVPDKRTIERFLKEKGE